MSVPVEVQIPPPVVQLTRLQKKTKSALPGATYEDLVAFVNYMQKDMLSTMLNSPISPPLPACSKREQPDSEVRVGLVNTNVMAELICLKIKDLVFSPTRLSAPTKYQIGTISKAVFEKTVGDVSDLSIDYSALFAKVINMIEHLVDTRRSDETHQNRIPVTADREIRILLTDIADNIKAMLISIVDTIAFMVHKHYTVVCTARLYHHMKSFCEPHQKDVNGFCTDKMFKEHSQQLEYDAISVSVPPPITVAEPALVELKAAAASETDKTYASSNAQLDRSTPVNADDDWQDV